MKIGLYDVDSKIPNLPLMKLSTYHKAKGDSVEFYQPLLNGTYDLVYVSKIFKDTTIRYFPINQNIATGGSGLDLTSKLPDEIEHLYPDYSLYGVDYAMGFLTRGCNNSCPFCIVHKKEGSLHKNTELEEFWNGQKDLMLLDNSLTDYEHADIELKKIIEKGIHLNLCQGFNVRTIRPEIATLLSQIKLWTKDSQWHIAWDNIKDEERVMKGIKILNDCGIPNYRIMCYCIIGFNSTMEEDLHRVLKLNEMGLDPFVLPYNKKVKYCRYFAHWVNHKPTFKSCTFQEYLNNKNENNIKRENEIKKNNFLV